MSSTGSCSPLCEQLVGLPPFTPRPMYQFFHIILDEVGSEHQIGNADLGQIKLEMRRINIKTTTSFRQSKDVPLSTSVIHEKAKKQANHCVTCVYMPTSFTPCSLFARSKDSLLLRNVLRLLG